MGTTVQLPIRQSLERPPDSNEIPMRRPRPHRPLALCLLLAANTGIATAQEASVWDGWSAEGDSAERIGSGDGFLRLRASDDHSTILRAERPIADGRIELHWRAGPDARLSLRLRDADGHGHALRLTGSHPPGSLVDLGDEEANDALAIRWHHAEVILRGAVVEVRIDGGEPSRALDPRVLEGGLSVHVTGSGSVDLREPRIDRVPAAEWKTVLDGTKPIAPERWQPVPGGTWEVVDGAVAGHCAKSEPRHGILLSTFEVDDFAARLVYRAVQGNSGFYFRCERVQ